jgi:hypothetical protein
MTMNAAVISAAAPASALSHRQLDCRIQDPEPAPNDRSGAA